MASIRIEDIYEAAKRLRAQSNDGGPVLEFTLKGGKAPFSISYSFDEKKEHDSKVFHLCAEEFAKLLNEIALEKSKGSTKWHR